MDYNMINTAALSNIYSIVATTIIDNQILNTIKTKNSARQSG